MGVRGNKRVLLNLADCVTCIIVLTLLAFDEISTVCFALPPADPLTLLTPRMRDAFAREITCSHQGLLRLDHRDEPAGMEAVSIHA